MIPFLEFKRLSRNKTKDLSHVISAMNKQIKAWRRANRKMAWGIKKEEFDNIQSPPPLSEDDRSEGFIDVGLFYGFGDGGSRFFSFDAS